MKAVTYILSVICCTTLLSCKHEPQALPDKVVADNYPDEIKKILVDKCATSGCHNATSYTGAGALLLDSWEHLFNGSSNGAVVVPYNADNSSLLYFVNTFPELGTVAEPTMPYNGTALTREEYKTLKNWIDAGAPDKNGNIPFASNAATRQKIYMVQQGCDLAAVIDAEKQVVMRYISVGADYGTENPNNIVISPDGKYAYVAFWNAQLIQKIDTRTDSIIGMVATPRAFQKSIALNVDGSRLIACNWYAQDILLIDAVNMQILNNLGQDIRFISDFCGAPDGGFYATGQFGNTVYKISADGSYQQVSIDNKAPVQETGDHTPDPYSVIFSPTKDKYFVTCTKTNEVRVLTTNGDQLQQVLKVGDNPQKMAVSLTYPYLFVSCMNDTLGLKEVGSVYVIDYNTNAIVTKITGKFFQPYGLAVDDRNGLLFIFSRNEDKNGPPPHHSSPCNGRNGFYQVYDINTLEPFTSRRFEVTVDPYSAATRFRQ